MYKLEGKIGTYTGHPIEVVSLNPGDVIVLHLQEDVDYECANELVKNLQKAFPNNPVIFKHGCSLELHLKLWGKKNNTWALVFLKKF